MRKSVVLIDGENLVFRYQDMLKAGRKPLDKVRHIPDVLAWSYEISDCFNKEILRASYYTSAVGDEEALQMLKDKIATIGFYYSEGEYSGRCRLVPNIFKKEKKTHKSRLVDIHITIDAMRHSFSDGVDQIFIFTGDGDFISLFQDIMRRGKTVFVSGFSSGLDPRIPSIVDNFIPLDNSFFYPTLNKEA